MLFPAIFRRLEQDASRAAETDLSLAQRMVLATLTNRETTTMTDLSKALGITMGATTTLVDRLLTDGLIERTRSVRDRRVVYVQIIKAGRHALLSSKRRRLQVLGAYLARLDVAEVAALVHVFDKLAGAMQLEISFERDNEPEREPKEDPK